MAVGRIIYLQVGNGRKAGEAAVGWIQRPVEGASIDGGADRVAVIDAALDFSALVVVIPSSNFQIR